MFAVLAVSLMVLAPSAVDAQVGGLGGGVGGGGGFGVGGNFQNAGVVIDAKGVLRVKTYIDRTGRFGREQFKNAMASLDPKLSKLSYMRKISLNRLEAAAAERLARGEDLTDEMKYLAGMLRVQYVFLYPETNDIVIAGPAEGFASDLSGRVRGLTTGRSVVELQDLIVALRAFPPNGNKTNVIGVSIDPTEEGLARMQQFLAGLGRVVPADAGRIAQGLKQSLGMQTVRIDGISPKTHFAQVLVEADYRMKMIGIGLEQPPVKIKSYISLAKRAPRNALQRWYFTPWYQCVRVSEDETAMKLEGWKVKLVTESEMVQEGGGRVRSTGVDRASQAFCQSFSQMYDKLADVEPVYAQLRNLIDLSVAAAFIQDKDYYNQANWDLGVFANEQQVPVETYEVPKQVESTVNVVWKGNMLMTPIGGGVNIQPMRAIQKDILVPDEEKEVETKRASVSLSNLAEGQWWWD
jgi:hypothetical protein